MPQREIRQLFGAWRGVDTSSNVLQRDLKSFIQGENIRVNTDDTIEGRAGRAWAAQTEGWTANNNYQYPTYGLIKHKSIDRSTKLEKEKLLGVGSNLFELRTGQMFISYSGAGTAIFKVYYDFVAELWKCTVTLDGATQSGFPKTIQGAPGDVTALKDIRNAINSLANFVCYLTPNAVTNGVQASRDIDNPLTVYNANTATTQINTIAVSTSEQARVAIDTTLTADVISSTTTTVRLNILGNGTYAVVDKQEIGVGDLGASILGYQNISLSAGGATIYFEYWQRTYTIASDYLSMFVPEDSRFLLTKNYQYVNIPDTTYITCRPLVGDPENDTRPRASLLKYDGSSYFQAGMPQQKIISLTAAGSGGSLSAGTYRYLCRYKYIDNLGVTIFGNESTFSVGVGNIYSEVTTVSNDSVAVVHNCIGYTPGTNNFNYGHVIFANAGTQTVNGNGLSTPAFTVTSILTINFFRVRVGDWVVLKDTSNVIHRFRVYAVGWQAGPKGEVYLDIPSGTNITVANGAFASVGITIEIYRTKVGGSIFYKTGEAINDPTAATSTFTDTTADTALGEQYEGINIGQLRRDLPPPMENIVIHQGVLVGSGSLPIGTDDDAPTATDELYWSNAESLEYFPSGTNNTFCRGAKSGSITALASDNANNLIAFKDASFFNITGSLPEFNFTVTEICSGNVGCPSPQSIQKIADVIFFCSRIGPRAIKDGTIINVDSFIRPMEMFFKNIQYRLPNIGTGPEPNYVGPKIVHERTTSLYDETENIYYLFLNTLYSEDITDPTNFLASTYTLMYDFDKNLWLRDYITTTGGAAGGAIIYNGKPYFLGHARKTSGHRTSGLLSKQSDLGREIAEYNLDGNSNIYQTIQFQWDDAGDPTQDKMFKDLTILLVPERPLGVEIPNILSYDLYCSIYRNFNVVGTDGYSVVETVPNFSPNNGENYIIKLDNLNEKATSISIHISAPTRGEHLYFTGLQYTIVYPYTKESVSSQI